jgi:CDP-diglyceride synthetase
MDPDLERYRPTPSGLRPGIDLPVLLWIIPAAALVLAVLPMPYTYYMGMRWVVAGAAAFLAWKEYELGGRRANSYALIFGAFALLFNPILPIQLPRGLWVIFNVLACLVFVGHLRLRQGHRR